MKLESNIAKYVIFGLKIFGWSLALIGAFANGMGIDIGMSLSELTNFTFITVGSLIVLYTLTERSIQKLEEAKE